MYDINISKVVNGVIVKVGCRTFVFNSIDLAMDEIKGYILDPKVVEEEYKEVYPEAFLDQPEPVDPNTMESANVSTGMGERRL